MKKLYLMGLMLLLLLLSGCGASNAPKTEATAPITGATETASPAADVAETAPSAQAETNQPSSLDLTKMSSTMVYSYIYNMMCAPTDYEGMYFTVSGLCDAMTTDLATYHFIVIQDATACCAQGLEFILPENVAYPAVAKEIVLSGTWTPYEETDAEGNVQVFWHLVVPGAECIKS